MAPVLDQNVLRLDVSMDDRGFFSMEVCEAVKQLYGDLPPLKGRRGRIRFERASWNIFEV